MIELRTLGTIDLVGPDATRFDTLLRRPKRLALLAYLAIERASGRQRRDTLLAMFWPDADTARARAALRQALHVIRRAIGEDALEAVGDEELSLSLTAVRCDAVEFLRAVAEGRLGNALELYRGDLLPGLFIEAAPEFDQWLDSARQGLRTRALRVAGELADEALRRGDFPLAVEAARRGVDISPCDEPVNRRLILALDRHGDRAGALAAYDDLARRMAEQFDVPPSAESRALASAVRAREVPDLRLPDIPGPDTRPAVPQFKEARSLRASRRSQRLLACAIAVVSLAGDNTNPSYLAAATSNARVIPQSARDAYERGLRFLDKPDPVSLTRALQLFEQARDSEPLYANAFSGLGDAYLAFGYWNYLSPAESFPKAIAAAQRSIELDPRRPEPYATLGFARLYYDRDWSSAEAAFRRAIQLDSTYAPAHQRYAYLLAALGRADEARAEVVRATQLAPLSLTAATDAGFVFFYSGALHDARRQLESVLQRNAASPGAHLWLGRLDQREGDTEGALREYALVGTLSQWAPTVAGIGYLHAVRGENDQSRRALATLDSLALHQYVSRYAVALVHAALGEREAAFAALDSAVTERTNWVVWLARDARWDPLRADPRFARLLQRVGLASKNLPLSDHQAVR